MDAAAHTRLFSRLALLAICVLALAGLSWGLFTDTAPDVDASTSAILVGVLLTVAVSQIFTVRFIVIPAQFKQAVVASDDAVKSAATLAFSFSISIAIYGVVVSVFTSQGLLALLFGAIALAAYYVYFAHVRELADRSSPT